MDAARRSCDHRAHDSGRVARHRRALSIAPFLADFGAVLVEPLRVRAIDAPFVGLIVVLFCGAFWLARVRPTLAVALLFLSDEIEWTHERGGFSLAISVMVSAAVGIAFLTQPRLLRTLRRPAVRTVGIAFVVMAAAMALSLPGAAHRELVVAELVKLLEYTITFLIAHAAFAERADERVAFLAVSNAAIVVSLSALAQLVTGAPAGIPIGAHVLPRIAGLLAGPNQLAGYLGLLFPLVLVHAIDTRSRVSGAALALIVLALACTFSRGGLFGIAVAGLVVLQARPLGARLRRGGLVASGVVVAAIGFLLVAGKLTTLVGADEIARPDGLGTRTQLWHAALALFAQHPLVGVGAGNFETSLAAVGHPELHTHANSWYFEALADGGIALFAATLVWIASALRVVWSCAARRPFALGALAATAGFAAHGLFDDLVFYPTVAGTWWLIVGTAAGLCGEFTGRSEKPTAA